MLPTLTPPDSLRARLLRAVLLPALLVVAASAVFDYRSTSDLAQQIQDDSLLTTATALAARMSPDEDRETVEELRRHLSPSDIDLLRAAIPVFTELYLDHIDLEESLIYPEAKRVLSQRAQAGQGRKLALERHTA